MNTRIKFNFIFLKILGLVKNNLLPTMKKIVFRVKNLRKIRRLNLLIACYHHHTRQIVKSWLGTIQSQTYKSDKRGLGQINFNFQFFYLYEIVFGSTRQCVIQIFPNSYS